MKTIVDVPDELHVWLKTYAAQHRTTLRAVFIAALVRFQAFVARNEGDKDDKVES